MGTLLGVPILRIIVFGGPYEGPLILGNYHITPLHPLMQPPQVLTQSEILSPQAQDKWKLYMAGLSELKRTTRTKVGENS